VKYDELHCRTNAVGRLCARMHAGMPLVCVCVPDNLIGGGHYPIE